MKVRVHLVGGPHDGTVCDIDAPVPLVLNACLHGIVAEYHYCGTENSVAIYGVEPLETMRQRNSGMRSAA
jgi:hypothetical protein